MARFVWIGIALQLAVAAAGHFWSPVLDFSGILGTAIPFALGIWYGATVPRSYKEAWSGGFALGILGALLGGGAAIAVRDQSWMLLTYAPLASGATGVLGATVGRVGRAER